MVPYLLGSISLLALWGFSVYWGSSAEFSKSSWTKILSLGFIMPFAVFWIGFAMDGRNSTDLFGSMIWIESTIQNFAAVGLLVWGLLVLLSKDSSVNLDSQDNIWIVILPFILVPIFAWEIIQIIEMNIPFSGSEAGVVVGFILLFLYTIAVVLTRTGYRPSHGESNKRISLLMISLGLSMLGLVVLSSFFEELVTIYKLAEQQRAVDRTPVSISWLVPILAGLFMWGFLDNRRRAWGTSK